MFLDYFWSYTNQPRPFRPDGTFTDKKPVPTLGLDNYMEFILSRVAKPKIEVSGKFWRDLLESTNDENNVLFILIYYFFRLDRFNM